MGQLSKIRRLHLERETMELRQRGWGVHTIAQELNKVHKFQGPDEVTFTNVYNYLKSLPKDSVDMVKEETVQSIFIEPLEQLKKDLSDLRGPLLEKARNILAKPQDILSKEELFSLQTYLRHSEEIWDRIAKIENILKPEEVIKAKNVVIIKQFNEIKQMVNDVVNECENCKTKFYTKLAQIAEVQP